jgi:hypothetical protein
MSRRVWWVGLLGTGLALVGVWGAWVPHRAAALVLSGWDLAEFVKFVPGTSATRELFYLPVWCAALALGVVASGEWRVARGEGRGARGGWRVGLTAVALGLMVAVLPPYPDLLQGYGSAEFRWRFILGVGGGVVVLLLSLSSRRWPGRLTGALLVALALAGALPALWQFLKVRGAIQAIYGASLGWGWGLGAFVIGWGLVAASGGWLLLNRDPFRGGDAGAPAREGRFS